MKKLSKKLAIYITAIVLAIGFVLPASVFADASIDPMEKTVDVDYEDTIRAGSYCNSRAGDCHIGDAEFRWSVEWYYKDEYKASLQLKGGETYEAVVTVIGDNEEGQAYDFSGYVINLTANGGLFPYDEATGQSGEGQIYVPGLHSGTDQQGYGRMHSRFVKRIYQYKGLPAASHDY